MLIYNHKKEFIGIDSDDLKKLHYRSLSDLMNDCSDFADLFIKKPGYIHNFKNFKWIDFVLHSDANESKVLISANNKTFSALLKIKTIFLAEAPDENAFLIELHKLHQLNQEEISESETAFVPSDHVPTELPSFDDIEPTTLVEPDPLDVPQSKPVSYQPEIETPDLSLYNPESPFLADTAPVLQHKKETEQPVITTTTKPIIKTGDKPMLGDYRLSSANQALINDLEVAVDYQYNPQIAADELGLPVDLIEEFIGDYIVQSKEFKEELFKSVKEHDFNHLKNLSHKLKGVAANLRIEDSFEVLSLINSTHDMDEAEAYLKHFYNIIAKLEGKAPEYLVANETATSTLADDTPKEDLHTDEHDDDEIYQFATAIKQEREPETFVKNDEIYEFAPAQEKISEPETNTVNEDDEFYGLEEKDTLVFKKSDPEEIEPEPLPSEEIEPELLPIEEIKLDDIEAEEIEPELLPIEEINEKQIQTTPEITAEKELFKDLHYDNTKAAYELGMDTEFIDELKNDFVTHVLDQKEALQSALEKSDEATYKQIALELKGISDNLRIIDLSSTLDEILQSNDAKTASHHINQLYHYLVQL